MSSGYDEEKECPCCGFEECVCKPEPVCLGCNGRGSTWEGRDCPECNGTGIDHLYYGVYREEEDNE
jgi:hypothetical protein